MTPKQIPFDLTPAPAYRRDDFFVDASNHDALAWIDRWPDWPGPLLVVYGPKGCGKTHILHFWHQAAQGRGASVTMIDDIDLLMGDRAEEEKVFHLYNTAKESGGFILATAETPPSAWPIAIADLSSRLNAAPAVAVGAPDEQMMTVVLSKLFSDRQISVSADVIQFIVMRLERSFDAMHRLVNDIDRLSLSEKRAITVPLVKGLLKV